MLNYKIETKEDSAVLKIEGRVDNDGTAKFQEALDALGQTNVNKAVLDLRDLVFINSSGIGKLLIFYKKFKNLGKETVINGINDDIYTLFKAIRLDKLLKIVK